MTKDRIMLYQEQGKVYKLVKQQLSCPVKSTRIDFVDHADESSQPNSWADYFHQLATPQDDELFDSKYLRHLQIVYLLQLLTAQDISLKEVTDKDIKDIVKALNIRSLQIYMASLQSGLPDL